MRFHLSLNWLKGVNRRYRPLDGVNGKNRFRTPLKFYGESFGAIKILKIDFGSTESARENQNGSAIVNIMVCEYQVRI